VCGGGGSRKNAGKLGPAAYFGVSHRRRISHDEADCSLEMPGQMRKRTLLLLLAGKQCSTLLRIPQSIEQKPVLPANGDVLVHSAMTHHGYTIPVFVWSAAALHATVLARAIAADQRTESRRERARFRGLGISARLLSSRDVPKNDGEGEVRPKHVDRGHRRTGSHVATRKAIAQCSTRFASTYRVCWRREGWRVESDE